MRTTMMIKNVFGHAVYFAGHACARAERTWTSALFLVMAGTSGLASVCADDNWSFDVDGNSRGWEAAYGIHSMEARGGTLHLKMDPFDPQLLSGKEALNLKAEDFQGFELRMKSAVAGRMQLYWITVESPEWFGPDKKMVACNIIGDGGWHTYRIALNGQPAWKGTLTQLRFDPIEGAAGLVTGKNQKEVEFEIKYMKLYKETLGTLGDWTFDADGDAKGWVAYYGIHSMDVRGGTLHLRMDPFDPQLMSGMESLKLKADDFQGFEVRMKAKEKGYMNLYWVTVESPEFYGSDKKVVACDIIGDGEWHTYRLPLNAHPAWKGTLKHLRFDPIEGAAGLVSAKDQKEVDFEIEYLKLYKDADKGHP